MSALHKKQKTLIAKSAVPRGSVFITPTSNSLQPFIAYPTSGSFQNKRYTVSWPDPSFVVGWVWLCETRHISTYCQIMIYREKHILVCGVIIHYLHDFLMPETVKHTTDYYSYYFNNLLFLLLKDLVAELKEYIAARIANSPVST